MRKNFQEVKNFVYSHNGCIGYINFKSLLMQMKKISDKSIEILAEIAAERMEEVS